MIVWINGTFGVGKTTTAREIAKRSDRWRLFDPEHVGYLLTAHLSDFEFDDFQDLPPWRRLVPIVAKELIDETGDDLLAVQTVLVEEYWRQLRAGLEERRIKVLHVVLDADEATLRARILDDEVEREAEQWRLDHVGTFAAARPWLLESADLVVDTTQLSATEAALDICAAAAIGGGSGWRTGVAQKASCGGSS